MGHRRIGLITASYDERAGLLQLRRAGKALVPRIKAQDPGDFSILTARPAIDGAPMPLSDGRIELDEGEVLLEWEVSMFSGSEPTWAELCQLIVRLITKIRPIM